MTHTPEPLVNTSVSDRINMCLIACAGMDDPAKEIAKLRADNERLVDALENLLEDLEEYLPDLSRKEKFALVGTAREALDRVKEADIVDTEPEALGISQKGNE